MKIIAMRYDIITPGTKIIAVATEIITLVIEIIGVDS